MKKFLVLLVLAICLAGNIGCGLNIERKSMHHEELAPREVKVADGWITFDGFDRG